ncbi:MAG: uncharacterized protein KVP18_005043 [Porospora cf. gigantea A]|uniref:uncharacterized protein n=1 Tax=Porospora cf. gigantea A TaxID=2853593 RepID=UPI00355A83FA|nr:MAG: hypothetical protein KVP18_005043 [Porospora cf. gigantea A]
MLRRNVRLRKEYLLQKSLEEQQNSIADRKRRIVEAHKDVRPIPNDLVHQEKKMRTKLDLEDENSLRPHHESVDCEYSNARTPIVMITTSRNPGKKCLLLAKELKLLVPNSYRVNRGEYNLKSLAELAAVNNVTDIIEVSGTSPSGHPTTLTVSHVPFGPTAVFELKDVVLRHDLPEKPRTVSEAFPHLIFHNFSGPLGCRFQMILQNLFSEPRQVSQRVVTFANVGDQIRMRHHTWTSGIKGDVTEEIKSKRMLARARGGRLEAESLKDVQLHEEGPRFTLKPFKILRGSLDMMRTADVEWVIRRYINKAGTVLAKKIEDVAEEERAD